MKKRRKKRQSTSTRQRKKYNKKPHLRKLKVLGAAFSIMLVILMGTGMILFSFGRMNGYSMMPTLSNEDIFFITKGKPKRFDLVYLKTPNKMGERSVRRIIGMQGDDIYYQDDQLFVNGHGKSERYLNSRKKELIEGNLTPDFTLEKLTGEPRVPPDCYFVMGDNRQGATDSRDYQFVNQSELIGVVTTQVFPLDTIKTA